MQNKDNKAILDELLDLLHAYTTIRRKSVDSKLYLRMQGRDAQIALDDESVRESLLHHVGHLPVISSFLHPYVEHDVDLGHALKLLSVHDIGETGAGDVMFFQVTEDQQLREKTVARKLLNTEQLSRFQEFEALQTNEAKFAKSIDKLAGTTYALMQDPKIEKKRRDYYGLSLEILREYKLPLMEWDAFLAGFYQAAIERMQETFG